VIGPLTLPNPSYNAFVNNAELGQRSSEATAPAMPDLYPALQMFKGVPRYGWLRFAGQMAFLLGGAVLILPSLFVNSLFPSWAGSPKASLFFLANIALVILLALALNQKAGYWGMALIQSRDEKVIGPPKGGETYVGVAYCDGVWAFREFASWDRGYVSLLDGCVCFRGFCSDFRLPIVAIRDVRYQAPRRGGGRVYVDWSTPDGVANTLSLALDGARSRTEAVEGTQRLVDLLHAQTSTVHPLEVEPKFPFESAQLDFSRGSAMGPVQSLDRVVAGVYFVAKFSVAVALAFASKKYLNMSPAFFGALALPFSLAGYNFVIFQRVRRRGATIQ